MGVDGKYAVHFLRRHGRSGSGGKCFSLGSERRNKSLAFIFIVATINAWKSSTTPPKITPNQARHGVSLALATNLDWETLWAEPDVRRNQGEERFIGFA